MMKRSACGCLAAAAAMVCASAASATVLRSFDEINANGLTFGTTDLFSFGGWAHDDTRSAGANQFASISGGAGAFSGAGVAIAIAATELPGGTLAEGNVLRLSVWVGSDPADPFVPNTLPVSALKFEFYNAELGNRDQNLLFDTEVNLPPDIGRTVVENLSTTVWTQFVYEYEFTAFDFDPTSLADVRPVLIFGDFSGNPATATGTLLVDRPVVEHFVDAAAAAASPVDTTSPGEFPQPPMPGACCLPDTSCLDNQLPADCAAAGGVFQGNGTTCATTVCPDPMGGCCLPDGTCAILSVADCSAASGVYAGDDTVCGDVICVVVGGGADCPCELDGDLAQVNVFDLLAYLDCWFNASAGNPCP